MEDYQQRVVDEKSELDKRLETLTKFLAGEVSATIDAEECVRLEKQQSLMAQYSAILQERIDNFS